MTTRPEFRHILVIEDQKSRRTASLNEDNYAIGRDPTSAIPLYDRQVSRHHATLVRVDEPDSDHYFYRLIDGDLEGHKSTNGIVVNGQRVLSHELRHGDSIFFGSKAKASYHIISAASDPEILPLEASAIPTSQETIAPSFDAKNTFSPEARRGRTATATLGDDEMSTSIFSVGSKESEQKEVIHLPSVAEYSPYPMFEMDFSGQLTYINPVASVKFPDLSQTPSHHPLCQHLMIADAHRDGTSFVRELEIDKAFFEQHIHYFSENQLIRSYIIDISRIKQVEQRLIGVLDRFELFYRLGGDGIIVIDAASKQVVDTNPAACELLGYTTKEILALDLYGLVALDREGIDRNLSKVASDHPITQTESLYRCQDGSLISATVQISLKTYRQQSVYCVVVRDTSDRKQLEEKLNYQTLHDALTQLPNRTLFNRQLSLALNHAQHYQHLLAVIFLDVDSFKHINATLGHAVGDRLLQELGQRLSACVSAKEMVARWGSDEFSLLLPQIRNTEETIELAQKIFEQLLSPFAIDTHNLQVKSSLGIAIYPQDGETAEELLMHADAALSYTKQQGKNHYQFYNPQFSETASQKLTLETLLHQALDKKQLFLHYQPQIDGQSGKVIAVEALLRWEHPEHGLIPPAKFIPLAAKTDLMVHIGKWVLLTACEQNYGWQKDGLPPIPIAVNLSLREFQQPNLATIVARTLEQSRLDPQWLELEIAEITLRQNLKTAHSTLRDLQQLGVRLALDDYGTGLASLGYLKQFHFNTLKLDQVLVRDLRGSTQDKALITAMMAIAEGYNLRIVAEGVETETQWEILRNLNCTLIQGYRFSRPLSAKAFADFYRKSHRAIEDHHSIIR